MQKSKREDFRAEEEVRAQKAKFEEANEDVLRRMQDIQEMEVESTADLGEFLEAELNYYARCHEMLLQLKKEWPARYALWCICPSDLTTEAVLGPVSAARARVPFPPLTKNRNGRIAFAPCALPHQAQTTRPRATPTMVTARTSSAP